MVIRKFQIRHKGKILIRLGRFAKDVLKKAYPSYIDFICTAGNVYSEYRFLAIGGKFPLSNFYIKEI